MNLLNKFIFQAAEKFYVVFIINLILLLPNMGLSSFLTI